MVSTGKGYSIRRNTGTAALDVDLAARWVELRTAYGRGKVKGKDLVTDEVATRSNVGGKSEVEGSTGF